MLKMKHSMYEHIHFVLIHFFHLGDNEFLHDELDTLCNYLLMKLHNNYFVLASKLQDHRSLLMQYQYLALQEASRDNEVLTSEEFLHHKLPSAQVHQVNLHA